MWVRSYPGTPLCVSVNLTAFEGQAHLSDIANWYSKAHAELVAPYGPNDMLLASVSVHAYRSTAWERGYKAVRTGGVPRQAKSQV